MGKKASTGASHGRQGGRLSGVNKLRRKLKKQPTFRTVGKAAKQKAKRRSATSSSMSGPSTAVMQIAEAIADELGLEAAAPHTLAVHPAAAVQEQHLQLPSLARKEISVSPYSK